MQEGWECIKCHNVYAPNTPFCLYCWFQSQNNITQNTDEIIANNICNENNNNISKQEIDQSEKSEQVIQYKAPNSFTKDQILSRESISDNKNLVIEYVNNDIPPLDKAPNKILSNKWPDTEIYLTGIGHSKERALLRKFKIPYILDSIIDLPVLPSELVKKYFDYIKKNNIKYMLDSGAFSYMMNPKKSLDLKAHLKQYCFYINEFDIKDFFELDLDVFMSIDEIENIRKKIYLETHKRPIIVYHIERGHDYWINMCKDNEFIAVGGMASAKAKEERWNFDKSTELCDEAHMYGTKVHGLGCTPLQVLNSHQMCFDTVDSTSWNFTKHGYSAALNEKGEIIKIPPIKTFNTIEAQEEDLKIWSKFATDYRGSVRTIGEKL